MMRSLRHQTGLSFAGWMVLLVALSSIVTVGLKVVPLYIEHNTMSKILDQLALENGHGIKSKREIRELIQRRLKLNSIRDFPVSEKIEIKYALKSTELIMDYEVRVPLVHNIDLMVSFNKEVELRN